MYHNSLQKHVHSSCPIKTGYCKQMLLNLESIKINFVESNLKILKFMWPETEKYNSCNISIFHLTLK